MTTLNLGGMQSMSLLTGSIDYSQIIQQLDQANRAPGDALNQVIQTYQLKQNDWSNISKLAATVQNDLVTLANSSTFQSYTTAISGTNSSDFTATASTGAVAGTYNVTVTQQLVNAAVTSGAQIGRSVNLNTTISSAVFDQVISSGTTLSVTVGSATHSYTVQSGDTINSIMTGLLNGTGVTWAMGSGANADQLQITNNSGQTITFGSAGDTNNFFAAIGIAGSSINNGASALSQIIGHAQLGSTLDKGNFASALTYSGAGTISINGVHIDYNTQSDSLQNIIDRINSSTAGVTASYDVVGDKLTLTSKTSQPISVQDAPTTGNPSTTDNLAEVLGLSATSPTAPSVTTGKPWQYSINGGATLTSPSSAISNVIPGVTLNIQAPAGAISASTPSLTATVTVSQDNSVLTKNVNAFVADFNNLYHQLQQYTQKGGDLQGDEAAAQLAFQYMNDVLNPVSTSTAYPQNAVTGIGISNGPIGSAPGTTNTLQVDATQLTTAFQNNPAEVRDILQGMATRLNQDLVNMTGQFNVLTPITSSNSTMTGVAQSQEDLYSTMISNTEQQQQQIYSQADQEAQQMQLEFTQLQQYQQQTAMQLRAISGLGSTVLG